MDPFLTLLHSFSSSLSESELSDLKFLCRDKIGKRKLECVRSGRELFSLLLEQRAIGSDSVGFLETMLRTIKREDLMVRLQQFVEGGEVNAAELPDANEKRLQKAAIEVICENVGRDWKMLMRSLGFPEVKIERIVTAHPFNLYEQLIQSLQEWQKWKGKDAKVADLIKALRHCSMNLVADRVEQKLLQMNTENK